VTPQEGPGDPSEAVEYYARNVILVVIFAVMILGFACFGAALLGVLWLLISP
jgi:hypothetical protein